MEIGVVRVQNNEGEHIDPCCANNVPIQIELQLVLQHGFRVKPPRAFPVDNHEFSGGFVNKQCVDSAGNPSMRIKHQLLRCMESPYRVNMRV